MPSKKPIVFKLNGKQVFDPKSIAVPGIEKVLKILDGSELGTVFETGELAERLKIGTDPFSRRYGAELRKRSYGLKIGNRTFYGTQESMKAFKHAIDN